MRDETAATTAPVALDAAADGGATSLMDFGNEAACSEAMISSFIGFGRQTEVCRTCCLLAAGLESASGLIESGLHSHDAKLPILNFAMRRHHPHEVNWMARH